MTDDYDHEGTLREISISSADDEDMRAAEWALEEIERLREQETYLLKRYELSKAENERLTKSNTILRATQ